MIIELNRVKMYLKATWVAIAAIAHRIVSMKMLIVPALYSQSIISFANYEHPNTFNCKKP